MVEKTEPFAQIVMGTAQFFGFGQLENMQRQIVGQTEFGITYISEIKMETEIGMFRKKFVIKKTDAYHRSKIRIIFAGFELIRIKSAGIIQCAFRISLISHYLNLNIILILLSVNSPDIQKADLNAASYGLCLPASVPGVCGFSPIIP
jgi:hypothetical protein